MDGEIHRWGGCTRSVDAINTWQSVVRTAFKHLRDFPGVILGGLYYVHAESVVVLILYLLTCRQTNKAESNRRHVILLTGLNVRRTSLSEHAIILLQVKRIAKPTRERWLINADRGFPVDCSNTLACLTSYV